jgi:hypothetical protein
VYEAQVGVDPAGDWHSGTVVGARPEARGRVVFLDL